LITPEEMVRVPGGEFWMGQEDGRDEERPVHRVAVAPFRLCNYPVTNAQYRRFRPVDGADDLPVTSVNWFDAVEYCEWLSAESGRRFRLPTEAEWEFAARGGLDGCLYPWGNDAPELRTGYADRWHAGPEPVGTSEPNGYWLYDMCENVHEWCSDWYDPAYYSISPRENPKGPAAGSRKSSRGGAWRHHVKIARCAARSSIPPEFRYADYGFRVACEE
jgi:sulfatase modifying factor 1